MDDVPIPTKRVGSSYVEWAPIIAGAVAAAALSFVLLTAGAAIGLSLISPFPSQSYGKSAATLATAWALVVTIGSFLVGGYIAGRLRMTWGEGNPDEVEFRDGVHGFLVWSVGILLAGTLAATASSSTTMVGPQVGKASVYSSDRSSVLASTVDVMLRNNQVAPASPWQPANSDLRDEITRTLVTSIGAGQLTAAERTYLAQVVAQRTGAAAAEADKRVDIAYAEANRAVDQARRAVVLVGLVTTTALLFGLAATWYAAQRGGHHRDHNIPARFGFFRRPDDVKA
jgi:hypothetical protein